MLIPKGLKQKQFIAGYSTHPTNENKKLSWENKKLCQIFLHNFLFSSERAYIWSLVKNHLKISSVVQIRCIHMHMTLIYADIDMTAFANFFLKVQFTPSHGYNGWQALVRESVTITAKMQLLLLLSSTVLISLSSCQHNSQPDWVKVTKLCNCL